MTALLCPLGPAGPALSAREVVAALGLRAPLTNGRPRVAGMMIGSADGRAAVAGRSVGLGHPADRALLRELRTAVDAILVGPATLRAERYANLLDEDQRRLRVASGLPPHPIVATISRRGDVPTEIGLFAEPDARIQIYTETDARAGSGDGSGATVTVHRFPAGGATPAAVLAHLHEACGARAVLCEGGPTLLRALVADGCLDHLMLTLAPLLVAGDAPALLSGEPLEPPARLALRGVRRADDHLFLHYGATS